MPPKETPRDERDEARAQPTEELTGLELTGIEESAAGLAAVRESFEFAVREMGPVAGLKMLKKLNQTDGFDCAGCAWPDPEPGERSFAEFCENGAKASAEENTRKRVGPEFFARCGVAKLSRKSDYWLGRQGRISRPMVLREGTAHYEPISWDEAFALIGEELRGLDSPDEAVFYTSGRTSNEAAFLYQLFARQYGTNNLPDCSNMCHESSGTGLSEVIGVGKGTVTLEDVENADVLVSIGQNPGTCHPRMLSALEAAKQNGGQIIAINPLPETGLNHFKQPQHLKNPLKAALTVVGKGTKLADLFLPVRVNGDVALLKGLMKELLEREERRPGEVFDHDFIEEHTSGFGAFVRDLRTESWAVIVEESGIARERIREAADIIDAGDGLIVSWAMGLTQHENAVANIQECVNLLLLRGAIGRPRAGALPVRGHSNVQGDRTVGIWDKPKPALLDALADAFDFEPPRHHGFDTVESIQAMHDGRARVFIGLGGNFLSATPDTEYTADALRRCGLTVQISTKLNRGHLVTGRRALILPVLGRSERDERPSGRQFVSVENSMGIVHKSVGATEPASEHLLSEPALVARMARATLGDDTTVAWEAMADDYDAIRDAIERVIPGFEDYNRRVREPGGFYLPNAVRDERRFETETGKAEFTVHPVPRRELEPGRLLMTTLRSHDQFNTTIYGLDDRYRGIENERRVVMMHAEDIRENGLEPGQVVDLVSHFEGEERVARRFIVVEYPIPRGCAGTYFPEANPLVPVESTADKSNTPTSKSVVISVRPAQDATPFDYEYAAEEQPAGL